MRNVLKFVLPLAVFLVFSIVVRENWFPAGEENPYRFVLLWGRSGTAPGEFNQPIGVAVKGNEVFVSDARNNRIQVFDREGKFLRMFGEEGDGYDELSRPVHIYIRKDQLYVAEYINDRIHVYSLGGKTIGLVALKEQGRTGFDGPSGVAVDDEENIYVADFYNHRVVVLDKNGNLLRQYGKTRVKGIRAGLFNYPTDVDLLPGGDLVVADAYNDRIQVFDKNGTVLRKWGGPFAVNISGSSHGWFRTATGVATDSEGNVFVADFYNNRIQKFSSEGKFLVSFGSRGSKPGELNRPTDVAVDDEGYLYVVDFGNDRVQKFAQ